MLERPFSPRAVLTGASGEDERRSTLWCVHSKRVHGPSSITAGLFLTGVVCRRLLCPLVKFDFFFHFKPQTLLSDRPTPEPTVCIFVEVIKFRSQAKHSKERKPQFNMLTTQFLNLYCDVRSVLMFEPTTQ